MLWLKFCFNGNLAIIVTIYHHSIFMILHALPIFNFLILAVFSCFSAVDPLPLLQNAFVMVSWQKLKRPVGPRTQPHSLTLIDQTSHDFMIWMCETLRRVFCIFLVESRVRCHYWWCLLLDLLGPASRGATGAGHRHRPHYPLTEVCDYILH